MRNIGKLTTILITIAFIFVGFGACEKQGPAEQAGEKLDNAVEEAGESMEEAGDEVREATEN